MALQISLYTLLARDASLDDTVKLAADAGFDALDIRMREDGIHITPDISDADAEGIGMTAECEGLHVSGLTTYWEAGHVEREAAAAQLAGIEAALNTASLMGAKFMRISTADYDRRYDYETCRAALRDQITRVADMGAEHNVIVTPEQHCGRYIASAGQCLDMLRGLEHPYLGIVFDPANAIAEGYERPWVQVRMLDEWIKAVHVKNRMTYEGALLPNGLLPMKDVRIPDGLLDWDDIIEELKAIGYDGYLTAEDFGQFDSLEEKLRWNAEFLRGLAERFE